MTKVEPISFQEVRPIEWRFGSEKFRVHRSDIIRLGLIPEIVEDDGIDLEIAAFNLPPGDLAALARGAEKDDHTWVVMVPADSTKSSIEILSALDVSYSREI